MNKLCLLLTVVGVLAANVARANEPVTPAEVRDALLSQAPRNSTVLTGGVSIYHCQPLGAQILVERNQVVCVGARFEIYRWPVMISVTDKSGKQVFSGGVVNRPDRCTFSVTEIGYAIQPGEKVWLSVDSSGKIEPFDRTSCQLPDAGTADLNTARAPAMSKEDGLSTGRYRARWFDPSYHWKSPRRTKKTFAPRRRTGPR